MLPPPVTTFFAIGLLAVILLHQITKLLKVVYRKR
jgi:hypothetical protein